MPQKLKRELGNRLNACLMALFSLFYSASVAQVTYNAYAQVTSVTGSTLLAVSNVNETNHTFTVGGQVIVMQMKDDVIGTNTANTTTFGNLGSIANAGRFEVATISAVNRSAGTATSIALTTSLTNTYNTGVNSRVQVISFRLLNAAAFTTTAAITGAAWNGSVGGVIALQVGTDLTLSHSITANAIGFRGGSVSANYYGGGTSCTTVDYRTNSTNCGYKGEGIYSSTNTLFSNGIAKVINGGGGGGQDINGGGGGGGNYTAGGTGGCGWNNSTGCTTPCAGGLAGITLSTNITASRVFMGGGGGGGQQNNTASSAGGNGGGIILIKANRIITGGCATNPTITANGANSGNAGIDGAGGAGAGGSIVLNVPTYSVSAGCPLTVRANGGNGGSVTNSQAHSGGGAGGQGVVVYSIPQPTTNVTTITNNGTPGCNNSGCSSSAGSAGGTNSVGIVVNSSGVLPIELIAFEAKVNLNTVLVNWSTASEKNTNYFLVKRSTDAINWRTVDKVKANGTTKIEHAYNGIDYNPPSGWVYYKLTSIDYDLSEQHSPVVAVLVKSEGVVFNLYPNPAKDRLTVTTSENSTNFQIEILDALGRLRPVPILEILDSKMVLDISSLNKGIYFIRSINSYNKTNTKKLVIE